MTAASDSSSALERLRRGVAAPAEDVSERPVAPPDTRPADSPADSSGAPPVDEPAPPSLDAVVEHRAEAVEERRAETIEEHPAPAARPRRALAAPGEISRRRIRRHTRALRTTGLAPETAAQRRRREGRRADVEAAMARLRPDDAPARLRPRADLSEILDRLGSPDLARFTAPLVGTVERLLPGEQAAGDPTPADRRRLAAEERRRRSLEERRRRAAEHARRRAEEAARLEREAAERAAAEHGSRTAAAEAGAAEEERAREAARVREDRLRARRAAALAAAEDRARRVAEARELQHQEELREAQAALLAAARADAEERARLEAEVRRRQERADEERRRRQAAEIARRRREDERRRHRHEAERQRRLAAERKEREQAEAARRRAEQEERRRREAEVAAERARVQAERRAREEAEAAERERRRQEAEAERERREAEAERERRRRAAEAAEAERRRIAEEEARRRAEALEAARRALEARRAHAVRARRYTAASAERALAQARLLEDLARREAGLEEEETSRRMREHQDRESRALHRAARELDGPETIPAASQRPLLSQPDEGLTDEELLERARVWLPEWRRRERLSTKAAAIAHASGRSPRSRALGPATGPMPVLPGGAPPAEDPDVRVPATATDRRRQLGVLAAWAVFVLSGAWGLGLLGHVPGLAVLDAGSYRAAHGHRYGFTTTIFSLSPLHPAVWPVLWAALGGYALRQALPGEGGSARQRETGWPAAGAMLAVAAWFPLAVLVPWGLEMLVWLVALFLMVRVIRGLTDRPARGRTEALLVDGALGLFVGVLLAGAPTTVAAAPASWGVRLDWFPTELVATLVLAGVLVLGARLVLTDRGRMAVALGMAWTLLCLGLPRLLPTPLGAEQSAWVGLLAIFGAFALILVAGVRRSATRQDGPTSGQRDAART